MRKPSRFWLPIGLLMFFGSASVWAQSEDTLKLKVESSLRFDQNLFRLPADANALALIGKPSAAERIDINSLSLNFSTTLSLQRFELSANLTDNRYQNFSYLSFVAHNYNALWRWAITPHLHGNLGSQRQETLNNFADYQGFNVRNQRSSTSSRFDAAYELDGNWAVLAGVSRSGQTNQQELTAEGDYSAKSSEISLLFNASSGSTVSYTNRNTQGDYLNRAASSADLPDNGFRQMDSELKLHWVLSGKSVADLYTSQISRTHPNYALRDYSGRNAGMSVNWSFSGKSGLTAGWARELASYQTNYSNYSQTDRITLSPVWQLSPKTSLRARYEVAQIDYLGSPLGQLFTQRSDTTTEAGITFGWQPYHYLNINTSLESATRKSTLAGLDYESKMATVSAQFSY